jgi:PAS domain S-box-containing protein
MDFESLPHTAFRLLQDGALLTLGVLGYCEVKRYSEQRLRGWTKTALHGFIFSFIGVLTMIDPVFVATGVRLDLRNAAIVTAVLFGGVDVGAVCLVVLAVYRFTLGGAGVTAGIISLAVAFVVPAVEVWVCHRDGAPIRHRHLVRVTIAVAIGGVAVMGLFPPTGMSELALLQTASIWIVVLPLSILAAGSLIQHYEHGRSLKEALQQRESELRAILDNSPFAIFLKDREGRYRLINRTYTDWFGDPPEALYGKTASEAYLPSIAEPGARTDREVLEQGKITSLERPTESAKPGIKYVQTTKFPIRDHEGRIKGMAGFIADITERRQIDEQLKAREAELRAIFDNAPFAIVLKDTAGRYRLINRIYADWFGCRQEEIRGHTVYEVFPSEIADRISAGDRTVIETGAVLSYEEVALTTRPEIKHTQVTEFAIRDGQGTIIGAAGIVVDITDRKRAEEIVRHSEERFRALIEHSNGIVTIIRPDGVMAYRSPGGFGVLGYSQEEVTGQSIFDFIHPGEVEAVRGILHRIGVTPGERASSRTRARHKDGSWRHIAWTARNAEDIPGVGGIIINAQDVTETQRLEEQLHRSQKMEAVGRLAGGIAHDFNNILGAVLGFAGLLLEDLPEGTAQHGFAERIVKAGERAKELVRQILAFSRGTSVERKLTDLNQIVVETREMLRGSLPSSTQFDVATSNEDLIVEVNAAQMNQVLVNLCLNANDAIAGEPGRISVEVARATEEELAALTAPQNGGYRHSPYNDEIVAGTVRRDENYARLTVTDTGSGMNTEVLERIFDPFYTTKDRGRGTGLGLAVIHGIVLGYDGACVVRSRPGAGTTFVVYLPLAAPGLQPEPEASATPMLRGRERVLIVDDETDLGDALAIGLERLGYEVVAIENPEEALQILIESPDSWDVVISDQVMPQMKGLTLYDRLKEFRPALRFILCSGYSDGATEELALSAGVDAFFLKPVGPEELAAAIRRFVGGSIQIEAASDT